MGNLCGNFASEDPVPRSRISKLKRSSKATSTNLGSSIPTSKVDVSPGISLKSFSLDDLKIASKNFSWNHFSEKGFSGLSTRDGLIGKPLLLQDQELELLLLLRNTNWKACKDTRNGWQNAAGFLDSTIQNSHRCCSSTVILTWLGNSCNLKASDVLLDSNLKAKLSNFGLARNGPTGEETHVSTRVVGTHGYAAPEYLATVEWSLDCEA